jgi:amidophosphoribosyltransferase
MGVRLKLNVARWSKVNASSLSTTCRTRAITSRKIKEMIPAGAAEAFPHRQPANQRSCLRWCRHVATRQTAGQHKTEEEMRDHLGVDLAQIISPDGCISAVGASKAARASPQYCDACFSGE